MDEIRLRTQIHLAGDAPAPSDGTLERLTRRIPEVARAVNDIWGRAGIRFVLEPEVAIFPVVADLDGSGTFDVGDGEGEAFDVEVLDRLEDETDHLHVIVLDARDIDFHGMDALGIGYVAGHVLLDRGVVESPPGPDGEPGVLPLVLAHELGHVLGLDHVEEESNLMFHRNASGELTDAQVAEAREAAAGLDAVMD